jgi:hypothetical protein
MYSPHKKTSPSWRDEHGGAKIATVLEKRTSNYGTHGMSFQGAVFKHQYGKQLHKQNAKYVKQWGQQGSSNYKMLKKGENYNASIEGVHSAPLSFHEKTKKWWKKVFCLSVALH